MKTPAIESRSIADSRKLIGMAVAIALAHAAAAQAAESGGESTEAAMLSEVVVTGTAGGAEIKKLDASFAITTADAEEITEFAPKSTANLRAGRVVGELGRRLGRQRIRARLSGGR
jgi:hypothetical protein